jgi:hypothetical protein
MKGAFGYVVKTCLVSLLPTLLFPRYLLHKDWQLIYCTVVQKNDGRIGNYRSGNTNLYRRALGFD